jgi:hypothetical protein
MHGIIISLPFRLPVLPLPSLAFHCFHTHHIHSRNFDTHMDDCSNSCRVSGVLVEWQCGVLLSPTSDPAPWSSKSGNRTFFRWTRTIATAERRDVVMNGSQKRRLAQSIIILPCPQKKPATNNAVRCTVHNAQPLPGSERNQQTVRTMHMYLSCE